MLKTLSRYLYVAHLLSLDVVLGAVLGHFAFGFLPNGHNPTPWLSGLVLALVVWSIYCLDRVWDNQGAINVQSVRHQFYAENVAILRPLSYSCLVLAAIGAIFLDKNLWILGGSLALCVGVYLWVVSKAHASSMVQTLKEPITALLYTAGVAGMVLVGQGESLNWLAVAMALILLVVVFQNLLLFSWFEAFETTESPTLAIVWGNRITRTIISLVFFGILISIFILLPFAETAYQKRFLYIEAFMAGGGYAMSRFPRLLLRADRYRWVGDGILWLGWLLLI